MYINGLLATLILLLAVACKAQTNEQSPKPPVAIANPAEDPLAEIGDYVVEVYEDSKGNLWMGTIPNGVARWDGAHLTYFTMDNGLPSNSVVAIAEDLEGNIWFGTQGGLARYDGHKVTTFIKGLRHTRVSCLLTRKDGKIWVGTWGGVNLLDGETLTNFDLPVPDIELEPYQNTMDWVTEIYEDKDGNTWFTRDGYGACRFDGETFIHVNKENGLPSNNVQAICQDKEGAMWFGCRVTEKDNPEAEDRTGEGGLARYKDGKVDKFPDHPGLHQNDIYAIDKDRKGNIWIGANGHGLYRHDGKALEFIQWPKPLIVPYGLGIQSIQQSQSGDIWLGLSGGLFCLRDGGIVSVTKGGPWK